MHLGDRSFQKKTFPLTPIIKKLKKSTLGSNRSDEVGRILLDLIQKEPEPCFLLAAVLDFVERIDREQIVPHYTFASFELWLNQSSGLGFEENLRVRGKIVGKWVDRSAYQAFFPIGMGKVFEGTHFVTAHKSPDLDTTIASFWGWVDAFGARVGDSLHVWNLPGGAPSSQIEIQWIFENIFGKAVFSHLPKTRTALNLTGKDLMTRSGMVLKTLSDPIAGVDHEREHLAVVVVDSDGFYLGDWRSFDVEEVRQVIILLSTCLRWFENHLHLHLISVFAKEKLKLVSVEKGILDLFAKSIESCEPAMEFSHKQRREVSQFLTKILGVKEGLSVSFEKLGMSLADFVSIPFDGVKTLVKLMKDLFDGKGNLVESRPKIFSFLEIVVGQLHEAILKTRERLEKLDIAMKTKTDVFGHQPTFVTTLSDVDEIRQKMGPYVSLTVTYPDQGKMFPAGVIQAADLRKSILGTVSLRDFCNRDEMTIPAYLDVISVIDHHKTQLHTFAPPFAVIADAQSSNTLVARQAFEINDQHSLGGQTGESIEKQIKVLSKNSSSSSSRLLQRLLNKRNLWKKNSPFFIDPEREYTEYLHFLYGILDDTDLLSKVSVLDVECVASLLNRMKSIATGEEVEVISLDDIPKDKHFPKKAAKKILQTEEMYSLYKKVYDHREKEVALQILQGAKGSVSQIFADTKTQNGCCRVGQTKIFARNFSGFTKHATDIRHVWLEEAKKIAKEKPEVDLHIHMVSTIVSADEVYKGTDIHYSHKDEMWIWIPDQEIAIEHLKKFLSSFQLSPGLKGNPVEVECVGDRAQEYLDYFKESFLNVPMKKVSGKESFVILRYKAGSLNSRKAMISPFLPTL